MRTASRLHMDLVCGGGTPQLQSSKSFAACASGSRFLGGVQLLYIRRKTKALFHNNAILVHRYQHAAVDTRR